MAQPESKQGKEKRARPEDEFAGLSKDQLMALVKEGDEKLIALRKQLAASVKADRVELMKPAVQKEFTKKETEAIRTVFDRYDVDSSGCINVTELKALSVDLGHDMTDEEAQAALDEINMNDDNAIQFNEFLAWWGGAESRGGNSGTKLALMKAKLYAKTRAAEGVERAALLSKTSDGAHFGTRHKSISITHTIGDQDFTGMEAPTSLDVTVLPSTKTEFHQALEKAFPGAPQIVTKKESFFCCDDKIMMCPVSFMFEVKLNRSAGATGDDVDAAVHKAEEFVSFLDEYWAGLEDEDESSPKNMFDIKFISAEDRSEITIKCWVAIPEEDGVRGDPLKKFLSALLGMRDADEDVESLFSIICLSMKSARDGADFFKWDLDGSFVDVLNDLHVSAVAKFAPAVGKLVTAGQLVSTFANTWCSSDQKRGLAQKGLMSHLLHSVDVKARSRNALDAIDRICTSIAAFPKRLAEQRGTMSDEVAEEAAKIKERLTKLIHTSAQKDKPLAVLITRALLAAPDEMWEHPVITELHAAGAKAVAGITSVKIHHLGVNVSVALKNLPFVASIFGDNIGAPKERAEKAMHTLKSLKEALLVPEEAAVQFPASMAVLEEAGEDAPRMFMMFLTREYYGQEEPEDC